MKTAPVVSMASDTDHPFATIPEHQVWDLVEFMSFARVRVSYTYDNAAFRVNFLQVGMEQAQRLLNDWAGLDSFDAMEVFHPLETAE